MKWDVAIRKTIGVGAQRFELDVAFRSDVERLVLFGPSGAGKTMTLKAMFWRTVRCGKSAYSWNR